MLKKSLVVASLLLIGSSLVAQDSGLYLGVSYGKTTVDTGITNLTGTASLDESDMGTKIFAGYKVNKNISAEFQYIDFGDVTLKGNNGDKFKSSGVTYVFNQNNVSISSNVKSFGLSGIYSVDLTDNIKPYVKVGVHKWDETYTLETSSLSSNIQGGDDTDLFYGLGLNMEITSNVSARLEYEKYKATSDLNYLSVGIAYSF